MRSNPSRDLRARLLPASFRRAGILQSSVLVAIALASPKAVVGQGIPVVRVEQGANWTAADWQAFYSADQGSLIMPLSWMQALRQPNGELFLRDSMARYGFIASAPGALNPQGFPVGFLVATRTTSTPMFSMTCAACHTREINVNGINYRIDGGPGFSDMGAFMGDLARSVNHLLGSPLAFAQFQQAVGTPSEQLRIQLQEWYDLNNLVMASQLPAQPWGIGRLDALNFIMNRATGGDIGTSPNFLIPENVAPGDAPVRFPFLWNSDRQDLTQWAGTTVNGNAAYAMSRNATEACGVFGVMHPVGTDFLANNSLNYDGLAVIADLTPKIGSPKWPWQVDYAKARLGSQIFASNCASCHGVQPGQARPPVYDTWATPVHNVGTDTRYHNSLSRVSPVSGLLAGVQFEGQVVGSANQPSLYLTKVLNTLALYQRFPNLDLSIPGPGVVANGYEARVLHGIWAAAPYLHNGSVPTLAELLKPPAERVASFQVGPNYDIAKVGLAATQPGGSAAVFTATDGSGTNLGSGNSNAGHDFGTSLSALEKDALLEYLKIVGTCFEDVNADGNVDGCDLGVLLSQWGNCSPVACQCDFNSDGAVNGIDLGLLLSKWGPCLN